MDILQQIMSVANALQAYINVMATLLGMGAILFTQWHLPSPTPDKSLETIPGHLGSRLLPFVGPVAAFIACLILEWDKKFTAMDFARAFMSGVVSEFIFRIYYKTYKGV